MWFLFVFLMVAVSCRVFQGSSFNGYINQRGNYGFNYPGNWKGRETGTDVVFPFKHTSIEIVVVPTEPGESLETIQSETNDRQDVVAEFTSVDGIPALRRDILESSGRVIRRIYTIIHKDFTYHIILGTDEDNPDPEEISSLLESFEALVKSFRFLSK